MKIATRLIFVSVVLLILSACSKPVAIESKCDPPTLIPQNKSGGAKDTITVHITTGLPGAKVMWTDVPGPTPSENYGFTIVPSQDNKPTEGDAITVFGRTLRARTIKLGMTPSDSSIGTYTATPTPTP